MSIVTFMSGMPDPRAFDSSPLGKELLEIAEGKRPWPESNAKRQHYVPKFQLADFTLDGKTLFQLKTASGAPRKTTPTLAASKKFFYVYPDAEMEGGKVNVLEGFFAMVENHAAPILRQLAIGGALSDRQRATLYEIRPSGSSGSADPSGWSELRARPTQEKEDVLGPEIANMLPAEREFVTTVLRRMLD